MLVVVSLSFSASASESSGSAVPAAFDFDTGADSVFVRRLFSGVEGPAAAELGRLFVLVVTILTLGLGDSRAARRSGLLGAKRRDNRTVVLAVEASDAEAESDDEMSSGDW